MLSQSSTVIDFGDIQNRSRVTKAIVFQNIGNRYFIDFFLKKKPLIQIIIKNDFLELDL